MISQHDVELIEQAINDRKESVKTNAGVHGIMYGTDEDGDDFASVGYNLPDNLYAEIEDGTFGQLQALRIYL